MTASDVGAVTWHRSPRRPGRAMDWALNGLLIVLGLAIMVPFYWVLVYSLSPPHPATDIWWLPWPFTFENYTKIFKEIPLWLMFFNSVKVAALTTIGILAVSALAAYAFARLRFPGRDKLFALFLVSLLVPHQLTVVPTFILVRMFGLLDTHEGLILPNIIQAFGVFLLRQAFLSVPRDLEDAARIDGAGHGRIFWHIMLPLVKPVMAGLAILEFTYFFNDFFWPLVVITSQDKMTLPLGLVQLQGLHATNPAAWTFAAISVVVVPIFLLYLVLQRTISRSVAITGMGK